MSEHDVIAEWLRIAYDDYDSALYEYATLKTFSDKLTQIFVY